MVNHRSTLSLLEGLANVFRKQHASAVSHGCSPIRMFSSSAPAWQPTCVQHGLATRWAGNRASNRLAAAASRSGMQMQSLRGFAAQETSSKGWGQKPPVSMQTLLMAMMGGAIAIAAVKSYKDEKMQQVMKQSQQVVGKASVGGPFKLIDYNGKTFTNRDLLGEFALLYFGFTHCPDICPDELEKVSEAVTTVEKQTGVFVVPVFISVDPERDTPARIKDYVHEFHPKMLGLTGDLDAVKNTSKAYRVYYSKTGEEGAKDYLVDHSIIHYLIDPQGEFVTFYAKNYTAEQMTASIREHIANWKAAHPDEYHPGKTITPPPPESVPK